MTYNAGQNGQLITLVLFMVFSFSRSECPLPKTLYGRDGFHPDRHWRVRDCDVRAVQSGVMAVWLRFQAIKQDPRVERPEAGGDGDWAILAGLPDRPDWCPIQWIKRLNDFHGARPDKDAPLFVNPRDTSLPYTYSSALKDLYAMQRRVGVADEDLAGLHGPRVEGYNRTKAALGEDVAVAHGLWKSGANKRYDRIPMSKVVQITGAVAAGADADLGLDAGQVLASGARDAGPPRQRLHRRAISGDPSSPDEWASDEAGDELSGSDRERDLLPPGWRRENRTSRTGRPYPVYVGPAGVRAQSRVGAWRVYDDSELSPDRPSLGTPDPQSLSEQLPASAPSASLPSRPRSGGAATSSSGGSNLSRHQTEWQRPPNRRNVFERRLESATH